MIGTIFLEGFTFECLIGILSEERRVSQPLRLDIELDADFTTAVASDRIEDTINYAEVGAALKALALERQYQLVESFAAEGCALILALDSRILRARMTIRKPLAVPAADSVGVVLERFRD